MLFGGNEGAASGGSSTRGQTVAVCLRGPHRAHPVGLSTPEPDQAWSAGCRLLGVLPQFLIVPFAESFTWGLLRVFGSGSKQETNDIVQFCRRESGPIIARHTGRSDVGL